ncbi:MAG: radical SAM protein [Nitrospirae bacterium]|nr:radical SAM protein [Nitrospirota bacterium]
MAITEAHEFFIQWHITERCNLRCTHCYQDGAKTDEFSLPEAMDVIGEVYDLIDSWSETYGIEFFPSFNITGGEPFLRHDIFDILEEIAGKGFDIYLLTNGILINQEKAQRLADIGIKGVQVSIEGPEDIHDSIRGKGSFKASMRGVKNLLDSGLTVTLNTTLSDINAAGFMDMIEIASSKGAQKLGFSRLVPSGRGAGLLSHMLGTERVKDLYGHIFSAKTDGITIVTGDPVASQMRSSPNGDAGDIACGGCAAGVSGLTILSDGTITPCRRLPITIGNIRTDSLREVWSCSDVLNSLRDRKKYKGKCGTCNRWAHCRGCRAIAYAYSQSKGENDFLAEDPQCFIIGNES